MGKTVIRHGNVWAEETLPSEAFVCPECQASNCVFVKANHVIGGYQVFLSCGSCTCYYETAVLYGKDIKNASSNV